MSDPRVLPMVELRPVAPDAAEAAAPTIVEAEPVPPDRFAGAEPCTPPSLKENSATVEGAAPRAETIEGAIPTSRAGTEQHVLDGNRQDSHAAFEGAEVEGDRPEPISRSPLRRSGIVLWALPPAALLALGLFLLGLEHRPSARRTAAPRPVTTVPSAKKPHPPTSPVRIPPSTSRPAPAGSSSQPANPSTRSGSTYWRFAAIPGGRGNVFLGLYNPRQLTISTDVRIFIGRDVKREHVSVGPRGTIKLALPRAAGSTGQSSVGPLSVQTASALVPVLLVQGK